MLLTIVLWANLLLNAGIGLLLSYLLVSSAGTLYRERETLREILNVILSADTVFSAETGARLAQIGMRAVLRGMASKAPKAPKTPEAPPKRPAPVPQRIHKNEGASSGARAPMKGPKHRRKSTNDTTQESDEAPRGEDSCEGMEKVD